MSRRIVFACVFATCLGLTCRTAVAQEVVHALTGTVSSIDPVGKTITVFLDSGSKSVFKDMTNAKIRLSVDKKLLAGATNVDTFEKNGAYAIVFYFGEIDSRTAVALRSLGTGPFTAIEGTVKDFQGHQHTISIENKSGAVQTFKINENTVAEGNAGAVDGLKFQAQKDDHVRIVGTTQNGSPIALFVRDL